MRIARRKPHESTKLILCPGCTQIKWGVEHHVFPQCWYGDNPPYLWICHNCHQELHVQLKSPMPIPKDVILHLTTEFLRR